MYGVRFVRDDQLPKAQDWAMVRVHGGMTYFFIKESRITPRALERAWLAFRMLAGVPRGPLPIPEQRSIPTQPTGVDLTKRPQGLSLVKASV